MITSQKQGRLKLPLSSTHVQQLTRYFAHAFEHFKRYQSSHEEIFRRSLCIINDCYHLQSLKEQDNENDLVTKISTIADQIRLRKEPWFYEAFADAINNCLSPKLTYLYDEHQAIEDLRKLILSSTRS